MAKAQNPAKPGKAAGSKEDRLKAALKANMARRKAQMRARAAESDTKSGNDPREESS